MRCDICGTDYFGSGACPGCGYYARKDNRPAEASDPMSTSYNANQQSSRFNSVVNTYYRNTTHTPQQIKRAKALVIASAVFFAAVMIVVVVLINIDFNHDFNSFSIDLPNSMREDSQSKFVSYYQVHGIEAGEYTNNKVRFAYVVFDNADSKFDSSVTSIDRISESFGNYPDYEQISKSGDTLKFRMSSEGSMLFCHFRVVNENNRVYYLILASFDDQRRTYESKFDKYMTSFKAK